MLGRVEVAAQLGFEAGDADLCHVTMMVTSSGAVYISGLDDVAVALSNGMGSLLRRRYANE
jgi:hypothetical protein